MALPDAKDDAPETTTAHSSGKKIGTSLADKLKDLQVAPKPETEPETDTEAGAETRGKVASLFPVYSETAEVISGYDKLEGEGGLKEFAQACSAKDLIWFEDLGDGRWRAKGSKNSKNKRASRELAKQFNRRKTELLEAPKAKRERQGQPTVEEIIAQVVAAAKEKIPTITDKRVLKAKAQELSKADIIKGEDDGRGGYRVYAVEGVEGSQEIVDLIKAQKRELSAKSKEHFQKRGRLEKALKGLKGLK